jgi:hypothetical protein
MLSESARMTTAKEAAFRIEHPNSRPRVVKVVALDEASAASVRELARGGWKHTVFFTAVSVDWDPRRPPGSPIHAQLVALNGERHDLLEEVAAANLIVMIARAGARPEAAALIAEACALRRVMITGLLLTAEASSDADVAQTLAMLRPFAPMLVVSGEDDYVPAMLAALRA